MNKILAATTATLMVAVATLAFVVSFEQIRLYALSTGTVSPSLSWCIPFLVDLPILMASLKWLERSVHGEKARMAQGVLVAAATTSLLLNMAQAPHHWGAWAIALVPPAALMATVEMAMEELRRAAVRAVRVPIGREEAPKPMPRRAARRAAS
jgi:hypothetical protein